jgi:tungstate transport system substrate-binding protein
MRKVTYLISALLVCLSLLPAISRAGDNGRPQFNAVYGRGGPAITAATGSPGELGLLKSLAESFCKKTPCRIRWRKMGSGKALEALKKKRADVVMVHAPAAEKKAVAEGWACMRTLLGGNEFFIVGPRSDPAGIHAAETAADAYTRIAKKRARFFSRGDGSGTHKREMKIWGMAGITPKGEWYIVTHEFMGRTLRRADREEGYFMTDSSTFVVNRAVLRNLVVLFKGDSVLVNVYHGLIACPGGSDSSHDLSRMFLKFMASDKGQKIFREYGKKEYGIPLYNDAERARE